MFILSCIGICLGIIAYVVLFLALMTCSIISIIDKILCILFTLIFVFTIAFFSTEKLIYYTVTDFSYTKNNKIAVILYKDKIFKIDKTDKLFNKIDKITKVEFSKKSVFFDLIESEETVNNVFKD